MDRDKRRQQLSLSLSTSVGHDISAINSSASPLLSKTKPASRNKATMPELPADSHPNGVRKENTDEYNMSSICVTLRKASTMPCELVKTYNWYPEAAAVDALLPPGVTLSLKEILIYYPHHVRWQHVMLRLTHNDYRGSDILGIQATFRGPYQDHMSAPIMNQIQRDTVQRLLPAFKTTRYEGKGDSDMQINHLHPGTYLEKKMNGYTVPTFDNLLCGLAFIPTGRDAGMLTQCLIWYLAICDNFRPRLQLNVLHAHALLRALKLPVQSVGTQNLKRYALEQWRNGEPFDKVGVIPTLRESVEEGTMDEQHTGTPSRSRAVIDIQKDPIDVKMRVRVRFRHVLTFPFLALHGVFSEALKLGIDKAERRRAIRKGSVTRKGHAMMNGTETDDTPEHTLKRARQAEPTELAQPAQTPKRQRKYDAEPKSFGLHTTKRPTVSPITPRTSIQRRGSRMPMASPVKKRFSPLENQPT